MPQKASDIVKNGREGNGRVYFCSLLSAMIEEYRVSGRCEYVDRILKKLPVKIDVVELSALYSLWCFLREPAVPHVVVPYQGGGQGPVGWESIHGKNDCRLRFTSQIQQTISEVQYYGQDLYSSSAENVKDKAQKGFPSAREDAERIRQDALRYAEEEKRYAEQEALRIRTDAMKERDRILAEAREEAERIRAECSAAEEAEMQQTAAAAANRRFQQFWQDCQSSVLKEVEEVIARDNEEAEKAMIKINDVHDKMREETSALKATWYVALDDNIQRLKDIQSDLDQVMSTWQQSLYPRELAPLARCYTQLSVLLARSNIFTEELAARSGSSEPPADSGEGFAPQTLDELRRLWSNLITFQTQFEKSLGGLGMYAFSPKPGEPFDEFLHSPSADIDTFGHLTVKQCLTPGILRRTKSGEGEEEVIIPAIVELEEQ